MSENRRIAKNTLLLYLRMLLVMFVGLFTSRIVLCELGVTDYGLFNVVGGIVGMLSFINGCAAGATSRFLTFALGQRRRGESSSPENNYDYRETFSTAFFIHLALAFIIVLLGETVGMWYFNNKLVIPEGREYAAFWVYQLSVFSVFISFTQVPYGASVIANEKMGVYAYVGIVEVALKLLNAYLLIVSPWDKLIYIAVWSFCVSTGIALFYRFYCVRLFGESCRLRWVFKPALCRRLLSYSGWDLIGCFGAVARGQGVNLMLNAFFGPTVNAARAVVAQVENALEAFTGNFLTAVRPVIIKHYAAGEITRMLDLVYASAKFSTLLYAALAIPLIIESGQILRLWLGEPPPYTILFLRIVLFHYIWVQVNKCLIIAVHAVGDVRRLNIIAGSKIFIELPVAYLLLRLGFPADSTLIVLMLGSFVGMVMDVVVIKWNVRQFAVRAFVWRVLIGSVLLLVFPTIVAMSISVVVHLPDFFHLVIVCAVYWGCLLPVVYWFGLTSELRTKLWLLLNERLSRFPKRGAFT